MLRIAENRYGKSRVRLMHVTRDRPMHEVREWSVDVFLNGDFVTAHTEGDNSMVLPTDTMKNMVYVTAREAANGSIEEYAKALAHKLVSRHDHVTRAEINIQSSPWQRLSCNGEAQGSAFIRGSDEKQTTAITYNRNGTYNVRSGLADLVILKTAKSSFEGYIQDEYTTLKPASDRLFATSCSAEWVYGPYVKDFDAVRAHIRDTLLAKFAAHDSKSVQQTLYAMAEGALEAVPLIDEMNIVMPNKHCLLVDLARFGQDNANVVFVPTDEPYGVIQARVVRNP